MTLLYLDASIFISWLKEGKGDDPKFYQGVKQLIREIDEGKHRVIASHILTAEVFDHPDHKLKIENFDKMLDRFKPYPVDLRIALKARELRHNFGLATPDAIHLATAILYNAEYLCTTDNRLLGLNEKIKDINIVKSPPHISN